MIFVICIYLNGCSVLVFSGVVLGCNDQSLSLASPPVDDLEDVYELLLVLHGPIDLVVVTSAEIDHHVLVSEEEHERDGIVEFVHGVEVRNLRDIN